MFTPDGKSLRWFKGYPVPPLLTDMNTAKRSPSH
jgi:hypothetical protein